MKVAWSACARKMRLGERCSGCSGCGGRGRRRVAPVAAELIVIRRRLARCTPSRTERNLAIQYNTVIITIIIIIIIIIIKNEKIRVTLCENAAGTLYIVNKTSVDGQRKV